MDTRTRSASPVAPADVKLEQTPPVQDKISAYYSLVFPHFTFYIQTLSVTIGRRCAPNPTAPTSSTVEMPTVDVDLGALKSVSRLHAKIEYDQDEDRFVLVVIGRNGAWVDGVWSGSGTRAPLGERSQIQIASRTFHFVLPPPPPPEDTPSPSSQSSNNRARSPSVDITSISPPSSQPSHTPPPPAAHKLPAPLPEPQLAASQPPPPKPRPAPVSSPQLPNSNAIGKSSKAAASKKRKKGDVEPPVLPKLKPEEMPPKPPYTYAQLIYKAIRAIGEKATLQEICAWISSTHEYYQYADSSWMSSVRHNLSSNPAFQKLERCGGDRGKGFFWKLDEQHSQTLMEQEAKVTQAAAAGGLQGSSEGNVRGRKRDKGVALEPPLKRSVKGDHKGAPLPPPLTSTPLALKSSPPPTTTATAVPTPAASTSTAPPSTKVTTTTPATTGVFAYSTHPHHANAAPLPSPNTSGYSGTPMTTPNPYAAWTMHPMSTAGGTAQKQVTSVTPASASPRTEPPPSSSSASPVPPTPSQQPPAPTTHPPPPGQAGVPPVLDVNLPIVLGPIPPTHPDYSPMHPHNSAKEGYMILHERTLILDPDVFGGLTKETLANLEKMGTMAALQVLKEHMVKALKERRAKGRGRVKRMRGSGKKSGAPGANTTAATQVTNASNTLEQKPPVVESSVAPTAAALDSLLRPAGNPTTVVAVTDPGSPIVIVDDSEDDGPAAKRRKVDEVMAS